MPAESELITIGKFARLGGVSIKALRLYAERGLLPPAAVTAQSGYRLYARAQIQQLHRILILKSAGFGLTEIARQLAQQDEAGLLRLRETLAARAEQVQRQLSWIDGEIQAARATAAGPEPKVVIKRLPRLAVASVRRRIDSYDEADAMLGALGDQLAPADRLVAGAIWHDCGRRSRVIDCEAFWILNRGARAAARELEPVTVASILHAGDESTIGEGYEAAHRWIAGNRFRVAGPNREIYLGAGGSGALTEIQFPIERRN